MTDIAHILSGITNTDVEVTDRLCEGPLTVIHARLAIREPDNYNARPAHGAGTLAHNNLCGLGRQQDWACPPSSTNCPAVTPTARAPVVTPPGCATPCTTTPCALPSWRSGCGAAQNYEHPEYTALEGIVRFEHFLRDIGMPVTLKELGAKAEDIPYLAAHTKMGNGGTHTGYFVPLTPKDVEKVLHLADK